MAKSTIETHPEKGTIDEMIRRGESTGTIARTFDLHKTSVVRYRKKLLERDEKTKRKREEEANSPEFIRQQLQSLYTAATRAVQRAMSAGSASAQIQAQREARATLALIEKMLAKERVATPTSDGIPAHLIQAALIEALAPYPDAKTAVVEALTKLDAEPTP